MLEIIVKETDSSYHPWKATVKGDESKKADGTYAAEAVSRLLYEIRKDLGIKITIYEYGKEPLQKPEFYGVKRIPKKGDILYVDGCMESYGHVGGKAVVKAVAPSPYVDNSLDVTFEDIGMTYSWSNLEKEQEKLSKKYHNQIAECYDVIEERERLEKKLKKFK